MKNKEYTAKLKKAAIAHNKAQLLIGECEDEYCRRYGEHPSDIDDDFSIDALLGGALCSEDLTAESVNEGAVLAGMLSYKE